MEVIEYLISFVIIVFGTYGILAHLGVFRGKWHKSTFVYYTNLSNLLVVIFQILFIISRLNVNSGLYAFLRKPTVHMAVTLMIFVTFVIFHFILIPSMKKHSVGLEDMGLHKLDNMCVHYAVPLLTVIQWIIFADKSGLNLLSALYWMIIPLAYFIFIMIRAAGGNNIEGIDSKYPYLFIDRDILGEKRFWTNVIITIAAFYIIGCIFVFLAWIINNIF